MTNHPPGGRHNSSTNRVNGAGVWRAPSSNQRKRRSRRTGGSNRRNSDANRTSAASSTPEPQQRRSAHRRTFSNAPSGGAPADPLARSQASSNDRRRASTARNDAPTWDFAANADVLYARSVADGSQIGPPHLINVANLVLRRLEDLQSIVTLAMGGYMNYQMDGPAVVVHREQKSGQGAPSGPDEKETSEDSDLRQRPAAETKDEESSEDDDAMSEG